MSILAAAGKLYEAHKYQEVYEVTKDVVEKNPEDVEALWWFARACYDYGCEKENKEEKKKLFEEGLEKAKVCMEKHGNCAEGFKWASVLLGKMGDLVSTTEKIKSAYTIRDWATKAAELNPEDSTSQHVIGAWHCSVSSVSWTTRQLAKTFFADPPSSTYETALPYLLKSYELRSDNPTNNLLLGDCYVALKNKEEARKYYTEVSKISPVSAKQEQQKEDATKALKKL
eukprot:TRINITY_DN9289_c0_g1_i1.p1 TRINITY_DN9289_c0_g1~~TRINITY_DN9289_c0_g1_i1.p1  ORF type:complete len:228 (+),score=76.39 TRINITY_DN9289_c0_g1_i1:75-758(+)